AETPNLAIHTIRDRRKPSARCELAGPKPRGVRYFLQAHGGLARRRATCFVDDAHIGIDGPPPQRPDFWIGGLAPGTEESGRPYDKPLRSPDRSFRRDRPVRGRAPGFRGQLVFAAWKMEDGAVRPSGGHPEMNHIERPANHVVAKH